MKQLLRIILIFALSLVVVLAMVILFAVASDYRPDEKETLFTGDLRTEPISKDDTLVIAIWNIGYAGLDREMDFFYDGGRQVRTGEVQCSVNFSGISRFLAGLDSADMILLQEVDRSSRRSYRTDEAGGLCELLTDWQCFYGRNYDVFFVPLPLKSPMGAVNSGLLSLARYEPASVERFAYPGTYSWPKQLFMLDRCFVVMRFPLEGGKDLLVINTHNEAYDSGRIRDRQMAYLKDFLLLEYGRGNYVIAGGDWNQCPPDFQPAFTGQVFDTTNLKRIENDFLPGDWTWVFDMTVPSNRRIDIPYEKGLTKTTVIDYFLLSPNLASLGCRTTDLDFASSDHQPVLMQVIFSASETQ